MTLWKLRDDHWVFFSPLSPLSPMMHCTLFRHHFFTPSLLPNTTSPCSLTMSKRNFWTLILGLHIHKLSRLNPHQHNQTPQLKNRDHTITKNIDLNMSTHTQKMNRKSIWKNQDKYNIKDENLRSTDAALHRRVPRWTRTRHACGYDSGATRCSLLPPSPDTVEQ